MSFAGEKTRANLGIILGNVFVYVGIGLYLLWVLKGLDYDAIHATNAAPTLFSPSFATHIVAYLARVGGIAFELLWSVVPISGRNGLSNFLGQSSFGDSAYWFITTAIILYARKFIGDGENMLKSIHAVEDTLRQQGLTRKKGLAPPFAVSSPVPGLGSVQDTSPGSWWLVPITPSSPWFPIFWAAFWAVFGPLIAQFLTVEFHLPFPH